MSFVLDIEGAHLASLRRAGDFRGRRVLEIGCGEGRLTKGFAAEAESVFAFDPYPGLVAAATKLLEEETRRGVVRLAVASAVDIDLPRAAFDMAVFSWSY